MQNALKIYPFPQTPIPENEENEKNSVSESVSSSTTTRARAREEIIEDLSGYYCETFGTAARTTAMIITMTKKSTKSPR